MQKKIAVVTGASKGIGFAVSQGLAENGFHVVMTSRKIKNGKDACFKLQEEGLDVSYFHLDVTDEFHITELHKHLEHGFGRCDVLINNAAVFLDSHGPGPLKVPMTVMEETFKSNTLAPLRLAQEIIPLMKKHHYGRIVNVSSAFGQIESMQANHTAYRVSKAALNAVTAILAAETKGTNILINAVCPGWVRTDMGGPNAERTPEQGAEGIVWLAMLEDNGPTGGFFHDKQKMGW